MTTGPPAVGRQPEWLEIGSQALRPVLVVSRTAVFCSAEVQHPAQFTGASQTHTAQVLFRFCRSLPWDVPLQGVGPLEVLDESHLVLLCGSVQRRDEP